MWFNHRIICPKDIERMANSLDPDRCSFWVYTCLPEHGNFCQLIAVLWPLIIVKINFRSIAWERIGRFWTNAYAAILGLLTWQFFRQLIAEFLPLSIIKFLFPLSILRTNWWILTKFAFALILTSSSFGLLQVNLHQYITELWPLIDIRNVSIQFLESKLMDFDQILYVHWHWQ